MAAATSEFREIAATIARQINLPNPLLMGCMGAKNLVALNGESIIEKGVGIRGGLMFGVTCKRGVKVIVELRASDTYTVQIGRLRGVDYKVLHEASDLYFDNLGEWIARKLDLGDFI